MLISKRSNLHAVLVALMMLSYSSNGRSEEPYAFRGAQLGMSLSEVKRMPFPDKEKWPETSLLCSSLLRGDTSGGPVTIYLRLDAADEKVGVNKCAWASPLTDRSASLEFANVYVGGGAEAGRHRLMYYFMKDPSDGVERLFKIDIITSQPGFFERVSAGLAERFGSPARSEQRKVQNKAGALFDNRVLTWDNSVSSIQLHERFSRIDRSWLVYTHTALNNHYEAERRRVDGKPSDKL